MPRGFRQRSKQGCCWWHCLPASGWNGLAFTVSTRLAVRAGNRHRLGRVHGMQNTVLFAAVGLTPAAMTAIAEGIGWAPCWALLGAFATAGAVIHALTLSPFSRSTPPSTPRQEPSECASPAPITSS
jgi:hypothetical protein